MTTGATATLPSPQDAYNHIFDNVHARVFFSKLASEGHEPQNEKEAQDLLQLAGRLRHIDVQTQEKKASASKFSGALSALDKVLGQDSRYKQASQQEEALAIKQAADMLANDDSIYNAVLSLKANEAAMQASQQQ